MRDVTTYKHRVLGGHQLIANHREQRKLAKQYLLGIVRERRRPRRVETVQKAVEHIETVVTHLGPDDWMTRGGVWRQHRRRAVI